MTQLILIKTELYFEDLVSTNSEYHQYTCLNRIGGEGFRQTQRFKQSGQTKVDKIRTNMNSLLKQIIRTKANKGKKADSP